MPDHNEILRSFAQKTGNAEAVDKLRAALATPSGAKAAKVISAKHAYELEKAAKAAEQGDMSEAAQLAQSLMETPEGAQLAQQLKSIFGM